MTRVLVVGAGPTGLTAALELARHGISVQIVEKRDAPSPLSRAVGLLAPSMEILARTGVAAGIEAEAIAFQVVRIHRGDRLVARLPLNFDDRSRLWGLAQDRTEHHMIEGLSRLGVPVRFGEKLKAFAADASGITATLPGGDERHDILIGADGIHSAVRTGLGLSYEGFDLAGDWSIADVFAPGWRDPGAFHGFFLPYGEVCIVAPLEKHRFRVIASQPDALAALPVPMPVTEVRRAGSFTISVRQVPRYSDGRVFLAGDAAHCHSPVGGRGMNLGIADAADLARRIAGGDLTGYGPARHVAGRHVIRLSEGGRKTVQGPEWRRALAIGMLRMGTAVPPLGRSLMRFFVSA